MKKDTNNLFEELGNACKIEDYMNSNTSSFVHHTLCDFWESMCKKSEMSKSNIINKSEFNYSFFYDVINGRKIPARDKIIRLVLTMGLELDDCQQALRLSDKALLYPRVKRDSVIIYAINNKLNIAESNSILKEYNEETLK